MDLETFKRNTQAARRLYEVSERSLGAAQVSTLDRMGARPVDVQALIQAGIPAGGTLVSPRPAAAAIIGRPATAQAPAAMPTTVPTVAADTASAGGSDSTPPVLEPFAQWQAEHPILQVAPAGTGPAAEIQRTLARVQGGSTATYLNVQKAKLQQVAVDYGIPLWAIVGAGVLLAGGIGLFTWKAIRR